MKNIFFFLFPLFSATIFAQNGITSFPMPTGYTSVQTNPKNAIACDNAGNEWVGFKSIGLGKFDGTNWTMFDNTNTIMASDNISALGTESGNVIWVATQATTTTGNLYSFYGPTWTDFSSSINNNFVNAIVTHNSDVWIGTNAGLFKFNGASWTTFTAANSGLANDSVLSLAIDPSGNVLAGTHHGLSIQNGSGWTNYSSANINFPSNIITAIYSDTQNGTWLGTPNGVGRFQLPYFVPLDTIMPTPSNIYPHSPAPCKSISRSPHGGVLFAGYSNGSLIEVAWNRPAVYYYPTMLFGNNFGTFLSYNPANGKTWIVNAWGSSTLERSLFAFDGNNYNGFGLGDTPYNERYLDVNEVSAPILNHGDLFWNVSNHTYEVPKGSGIHSIEGSALWIGGLDNGGNLHVAAMTYRQNGNDFFPGPLDTTNGNADSTSAAQYDYIWRISKLKIQEFQYYWSIGAVQSGNYEVDHDILTWPAQGTGNFTRNMAPFIDVNHNGIYDPQTGGDYPDIKGDEELYCIYNDNLASHTETGGTPMKVEVHAAAYAYACPSIVDSEKVINYTTFYDYKIFNRSNLNYNNVFLGRWQDVLLGYYLNDLVGCVSHDNFSFAGEVDSIDGPTSNASPGYYGAHPPILSLASLDGPLADPGDGIDNNNNGTIDEPGEKNLMTGFHTYNNDFSRMGNPQTANDYYLYLTWRWPDSTNLNGTDVTYGGNGYGGTTPTHFMYDGFPYDTSAWTELSSGNYLFDHRTVNSAGPFTFNSGQEVNLTYANIFSRDTTVYYTDTAYYTQAVNDVRRIRNWYNNNNAPSCVQWVLGIPEQINEMHFSLYPNPTSSLLTIEYQPKNKDAEYEIFDLTGKIIDRGKINSFGETVLNVENYSSGIYLVRLIDNNNSSAMKFIRE